MSAADQLAHDALEACGATLTREQFGVFAWCHAEIEQAGWDRYHAITTRLN